jgi:hypothetical protein
MQTVLYCACVYLFIIILSPGTSYVARMALNLPSSWFSPLITGIASIHYHEWLYAKLERDNLPRNAWNSNISHLEPVISA